jgi:hypothetical protein
VRLIAASLSPDAAAGNGSFDPGSGGPEDYERPNSAIIADCMKRGGNVITASSR